MKEWFVRLVNFYNTNTLFHSAINGLEMTLGATFANLIVGGHFPPTSKADWSAISSGVLYALWSWWKRWSQENLATVGVSVKQ